MHVVSPETRHVGTLFFLFSRSRCGLLFFDGDIFIERIISSFFFGGYFVLSHFGEPRRNVIGVLSSLFLLPISQSEIEFRFLFRDIDFCIIFYLFSLDIFARLDLLILERKVRRVLLLLLFDLRLFFHLYLLFYLGLLLLILLNRRHVVLLFLLDFCTKIEPFWNEGRLFLLLRFDIDFGRLFERLLFLFFDRFFLRYIVLRNISVFVLAIEFHEFGSKSWLVLFLRLYLFGDMKRTAWHFWGFFWSLLQRLGLSRIAAVSPVLLDAEGLLLIFFNWGRRYFLLLLLFLPLLLLQLLPFLLLLIPNSFLMLLLFLLVGEIWHFFFLFHEIGLHHIDFVGVGSRLLRNLRLVDRFFLGRAISRRLFLADVLIH